jgi:hypothetical protein
MFKSPASGLFNPWKIEYHSLAADDIGRYTVFGYVYNRISAPNG